MNVSVACRNCGETFDADRRLVGRTTKCAICGAENPVTPRVDPEGPHDLLPAEREGLASVGTGLTSILLALSLLVGYVVVRGVGLLIDAGDLVRLLERLGPLLALVFQILVIVGQCYCLQVPDRSGARGFASAALPANMLSVLVQSRWALGEFRGQTRAIADAAALVVTSVTIGLFFLFLARTARFLRNTSVEAKAHTVLLGGPVIAVLYLLLRASTDRYLRLPEEGELGLGVTIAVLSVVWLLKFVGAIAGLRGAIRTVRDVGELTPRR